MRWLEEEEEEEEERWRMMMREKRSTRKRGRRNDRSRVGGVEGWRCLGLGWRRGFGVWICGGRIRGLDLGGAVTWRERASRAATDEVVSR